MRIKPNTRSLVRGVEESIHRVNEAFIEQYREVVWEIFVRLLEETPQFTGRAVAHWDIGIDAPSKFRDDSLGSDVNMLTGRHKKNGQFYKQDTAHRKGDLEWAQVAMDRNWPKLQLIHRGTRVYFSNMVHGDNDGGKSSVFYMKSMQDGTYWADKLRGVNKPYETAQETILQVQAAYAAGGPKQNGLFTYKRHRDAWKKLI